MKKIFTTCICLCSLAVSALAVTVSDVAGTYKGNLNIAGDLYPDKEVYILPGVEAGSITFVLPDFRYGAAPLGDIVLVNMPMDAGGRLTLEDATLYIRAISERATISVLNGLEDGGVTYNSEVSASAAQVLLSIAAPSLPEPIMVLFAGSKVTNENYAVTNGGFEGNWSGNEPNGWHSFPTATGEYASFVTGNTQQFQQSNEVRPGSTGAHSAVLQSNMVLSAKANGNCTNGRINAGATTADSPAKNYNFSDPSASGYNTPFVGNPDSLVFWAKYIPADKNPSNSENQARTSVAITTNARYQDPESSDSHAKAKVASAAINYSATSDMGWQRLSVPFTYTSVSPDKAAYVLVTFTTNKTPGGGSTYSTGGLFNKTYYYDNLYLDDVEMIYNHSLASFRMDGQPLSFTDGRAATEQIYSDSDYEFAVSTDGRAAKSFIGYDEANRQVAVYVVADNYSQAGAYSVYTLQMAEPVRDTEYAYSASTCDNEPYSDHLFTDLTEAGTYTTTIPNTQGGDSVITLTLSITPSYSFAEEASIRMDESYTWRGRTLGGYTPGVYHEDDSLLTVAGCDSVYTLTLTVQAIPYFFEETATACRNEETTWHHLPLPTGQTGTFVVFDSLTSVYATDSVYRLTLTVLPTWEAEETRYVNQAGFEWRGKTIPDLPTSAEPYFFYDSLTAANNCDSVYVLRLFVSDIPVTYGYYEEVICRGEHVLFEGTAYASAFEGEIRVAQPNRYGGDSLVHLTVTVLPSYTIDEYLTITLGDNIYWEGWNLSTMPEGQNTLYASYYTVDDCDSTLVLHLTVEPVNPMTALPGAPPSTGRCAHKVLINGRLFIIREDETVYDIIGTKIR